MKLVRYLQSRPTILLAIVIGIVSISIIVMVAIILSRLEKDKKVTRAALELKKITNSIRAGLVHFVLEEDCRILYASKGFYDLLGYDKGKIKAANRNSLFDFIDPRDIESIKNIFGQLSNEVICLEVRMLTRDGNVLYTLMNGNSVADKDGKHTISVVFVDISEQKQLQETILLEGERYRIAAELSNDVLFEYHIDKDEMIYTEKYRDLHGRSPVVNYYWNNVVNHRDQIHPDDWGIFLELCLDLHEGKSIIEAEYRIKSKMGNYIWCQLMGKTIYDDDKNPLRVIGKIVNVDTQKRELEALEYKATRDPLTGVYNKEATIKKIEKFINGNKNNKHVLMFIDLDDFKKINDTYGHLRGDKVLTHVIGRLKEEFYEGEIIGRIGGDEFVVFAGNTTHMEVAMKKAERLRSTLETTYEDDDNSITISGSIGIAIYPEDGLHYEQLMECADQALYRVKECGKNNFMLYTSTI